MAETSETTTYRFPYPTGEDSLSNVALRIQRLAERVEETYGLLGIDTSFSNLMQNGDAASGDLTGAYPAPTINDDKITNAMLKTDSVGSTNIIDGAVTGAKIISSVDLAGSPTTTTQPVSDSTSKIATTSFVNTIAANFVAGILSAGSVTSSMLAPMTYIDFSTTSPATLQEGRATWNTTEGTLSLGLEGGNVSIDVGITSIAHVKHADNTGLAKGKAVYIVGSTGANKTVRYALADSDPTSSKTFGIMDETVTGGNKGYVVTHGIIDNIDTLGLTEGAAIYVSPTVAGELTTTKPVAPNHLVLLGWCLRSSATVGAIFVHVVNGFELDELHDVRITSVQPNNILQYDATIPSWKNTTFANAIPSNTITNTMLANNTISSSKISLQYEGHVVVSNTASRPLSPNYGQMIYQSDTKQFLTYTFDNVDGDSWVAQDSSAGRNMLLNCCMNVNQRTLGPIHVSNRTLTTNVVTLNTSTPHGLRAGSTIIVSTGDPVFDGVFTLASTTLTALTYARTAGNVGNTTTNGWVTVAIPNITATNIGGSNPYNTINGYSTADRWKQFLTSNGTYIQSVVRDAPTGRSMRNSLKAYVSTINTTLGGIEEVRISQIIEGQEVQRIRKGTVDARRTVVSFWVKSNVPGTYILELVDSSNTRSVSQAYTIFSAATWEKKVILIPADATGVLPNDNTAGLELNWWLSAGGSYTSSGLLQTTWNARTTNRRAFGQTNLSGASTSVATTAATGTGTISTISVASHSFVVGDHITVAGVTPVNFNGTYVVSSVTPTTISYYHTAMGPQSIAGTVTGSYFQLTGVQFEVGAAASELEIVKYSDELLRCQRYHYRITNYALATSLYGMGTCGSAASSTTVIPLPVNMRIAPTTIETSGTPSDYYITNGAGSGFANTTNPSFVYGNVKNITINNVTTSGNLVVSQPSLVGFNSVIGTYIAVSAEL